MPYRRVPTDRAGMNGAAVDAAQARNHGLDRCAGFITDPPRPGRKPGRPRPCSVRLDPALVTAGYTTHPLCDPDEVSATAGPPGEPDSLARPAPPATDPADQAPAGKCGGCDHDWEGKVGGAPHPPQAKENPMPPLYLTPDAVTADLRALGYTPAEHGRRGWVTLWGAGDTVRIEHPEHRDPDGPTLVSLAERLNAAGWAAIIQEDGWISVDAQPWRAT